MILKFSLSRIGTILSAFVLSSLIIGNFIPVGYFSIIIFVNVLALTIFSFVIYKRFINNLAQKKLDSKSIDLSTYNTEQRKWRMFFGAVVMTGISILLFMIGNLELEYAIYAKISLLFTLAPAVYLFLASESAALKQIRKEAYYWLGGIALHLCIFFMLNPAEREFQNIVITLSSVSLITLIVSFVGVYIKTALSEKSWLSYAISSSGFTFLLSYSTFVAILRNFNIISGGYEYLDFALLIVFFLAMILGLDIGVENCTLNN